MIKSAQFLFHIWLPDAMEAPTPASALIHSSTLVIAGVFLILRFNILLELSVLTLYYLTVIGGLTLSINSLVAFYQIDIKKLTAYSTISQVGYLFFGCGCCCFEEVFLYLIMHALNKAFLFILIGYFVFFSNHNTDFRFMGGLLCYIPDVCIILLVVLTNLVGLPFSSNFFSKELILFGTSNTTNFFFFFFKSFWFLSLIFSPLYMYIFFKNTLFGFLKTNWVSFLKISNYEKVLIVTNFSNKSCNLVNNLTIFNSKLSIFFFFFFITMLNYFGDFFFFFIFNFYSNTDLINSSFFFLLKSNYFFDLYDWSNNSTRILNNFIYFFLFFNFFILNFFFLNNRLNVFSFFFYTYLVLLIL